MPDPSHIVAQLTLQLTSFLGTSTASIWVWLIIGYAAMVAVLATYAASISLSSRNAQQRAQTYRVLKHILGKTTGLIGIALRLHETGLI